MWDSIRERLRLQGNPAVNDVWWKNPKTGHVVDFIDFARSEGRVCKHFDKDGNPSPTLLMAKQDRLENWHVLQDLAGVRGVKKATGPTGDKSIAAGEKASAPKSGLQKPEASKLTPVGLAKQAKA